MREARLGDRYLLCSDGLSDVVTEETLHKTLMGYADLEEAVLALIELAIRSGGPDNITCVLADVVDTVTGPLPPSEKAVVVGAAGYGEARQPRVRSDSPAGRAHQLTQTAQVPPAADRRGANAAALARGRASAASGPDGSAWAQDGQDGAAAEPDDDDEYAEGTSGAARRWPVVTSVLVLLLILIAGGGYAAWRYTRSQYYVGTDAGQVVIYRGRRPERGRAAAVRRVPAHRDPGVGRPGQRSRIGAQHDPGRQPGQGPADRAASLRRNYACNVRAGRLATWRKNKPKPVTGQDQGQAARPSRGPRPRRITSPSPRYRPTARTGAGRMTRDLRRLRAAPPSRTAAGPDAARPARHRAAHAGLRGGGRAVRLRRAWASA